MCAPRQGRSGRELGIEQLLLWSKQESGAGEDSSGHGESTAQFGCWSLDFFCRRSHIQVTTAIAPFTRPSVSSFLPLSIFDEKEDIGVMTRTRSTAGLVAYLVARIIL